MIKVVTSRGLEEFVRTGAVSKVEMPPPADANAPAATAADTMAPGADAVKAPVRTDATAEELRIAEDFGKQQYTRAQLAEQRATELERERVAAQRTNVQPLQPASDDPNAPKIAQFTDSNGAVDWDRLTTAKSEYASRKAVNDERNRVAPNPLTQGATQ